MPEDINPNSQPDSKTPDVNSIDERVARLEEAVAKILEMLQSGNMTMSKENDEKMEEKKKDDSVKEDGTPLPKAEAEKIQSKPEPAKSEEESGNGKELVEKELKEIKKTLDAQMSSLKELSELRKILELNKSTTPRPTYDNKEIQKSIIRPKNMAMATRMVRGMK